MAQFKVVAPKPMGVTFDMSKGSYDLEMESLAPVGAEIIEISPEPEDSFIAAVKDADALIGRGSLITKRIIDSLESC